MKYDFGELINRRGTNSLKWDVAEGELPMWVADMDFKTAPEILSALESKLKTGILGYQIVPESWYKAFAGWWKRRHARTHSPLRDGLLLLPQPAETAAVPVGECGRRGLQLV